MIVDGHAHISATDYGNAAALLAQLDQAGIERALCVPGGMIDVRRFSHILSGRLRPDTNIPNHLVYDAIDRHGDRLDGLVCVNPCHGSGALETVRQGFEHGCRGVKLAPMVHGFAFSEPVLEEVAAACAERAFPVYSHVLPKPGSTTADYAALARRCPKTRFILGHMGFGPGDVDAIDFAAELDNFYLETSLGNWLILRDALARLGPDKLIFGSEFPLGHPRAELENVLLLEPSSHEAILGGNILRLIGAEGDRPAFPDSAIETLRSESSHRPACEKPPGPLSSRNPETHRLYWPVEQIRSYQQDRFRETLSRAAKTAYYASRLAGARVDSLEDLARLPFTSKDDVRAASPYGLLAVEPSELFQYHESYGTTGKPTSSWMTRRDFQNFATQINHAAVDFRPGDRVLVRFPYAISVPAHIVTQAARNRGACVIPAGSRTTISPYPRVIELLGKLEATVLACLPTEAVWLAEAARQMGRDPARDFPHLRAIVTAGELLTAARRKRIADLWGARVYNMYGCTEAGNLAADCPAGRLHVSWDHFLLEVLDGRTGQPVQPGQLGAAVVTTLTREAMPLVRFRLGDYLKLLPEACPCGRAAPVIEHYGRDLNLFEFRGRTFFVRDLEDRLLSAPPEAIGDFWLVEVHSGEVRFRVEAARPDSSLYRDLQERIREDLDLPLRIDAVPPGRLLDRARFAKVEPVRKPLVVGYAKNPAAAPLSLDDLM